MQTLDAVSMFIGMILAIGSGPAISLLFFGKVPGFTIGVLIGTPIWMVSAVYLGYFGGAFGEEVLGTRVGVPLGLITAMVGGSLLASVGSGLVAAFIRWLMSTSTIIAVLRAVSDRFGGGEKKVPPVEPDH
jgi:hypothetical protein